MHLYIRKLLGRLGLANYCPECGKPMIPQGYYDERSYCPDHPYDYTQFTENNGSKRHGAPPSDVRIIKHRTTEGG